MVQKQAIFTLIGGRVNIYRGRYNPTSDAVWLAACAADAPANTVLDVGVGTGGAALCLGAHRPDARITGIDTSPEMLAECAQNAELNAHDIELINADILSWRTDRTFDLVISNPPYFSGTPAAHGAHHNADLGTWTRKCAARVRPHGTICMITDTAKLNIVIAELTGRCGDITIFPLFGAKNTAERVLVRARAGTHGPTVLHRGLPMNCETVLRHGLTIDSTLARLDIA